MRVRYTGCNPLSLSTHLCALADIVVVLLDPCLDFYEGDEEAEIGSERVVVSFRLQPGGDAIV